MNLQFEPFKYIIDILFPTFCISCKKYIGKNKEIICNNCYLSISVDPYFKCGKCKKRTPVISGKLKTCSCKSKVTFGALNHYSLPALNSIITSLKYRGVKKASEPLGVLLGNLIKESNLNTDNSIIIPIPLSKSRERERSYNQAELIATEFLKHITTLNTELRTDILKRIKETAPQTKTGSRVLRKENLKNAFQVTEMNAIKGKQIILIDDVTTSGATAEEASNTLIKAGAKKIIILTAARA